MLRSLALLVVVVVVGAFSCPVFHLADVDGDGQDEFVMATDTTLIAMSGDFFCHGRSYLTDPNLGNITAAFSFAVPNLNLTCITNTTTLLCFEWPNKQVFAQPFPFDPHYQKVLVFDHDSLLLITSAEIQRWKYSHSMFHLVSSHSHPTANPTPSSQFVVGNFLLNSPRQLLRIEANGTASLCDSCLSCTLLPYTVPRSFIQIATHKHQNQEPDHLLILAKDGLLSAFALAPNYSFILLYEHQTTGAVAFSVSFSKLVIFVQNGDKCVFQLLEQKEENWVWMFTQLVPSLDEDQDGDSIVTRVELGHIAAEPLHTLGASPFVQDVFVHLDWMQNRQPSENARSLAMAEMATAGINLHVILGSAIPFVDNLGGQGEWNWTLHFDPIKDVYFPKTRQGIYHYGLFANKHNGGSVSGRSRSIPGADFIITLGGWADGGTDLQQAGTLLHEIGHNLNLRHGGSDNENYKPNHISIMNYLYQVRGLMQDGKRRFLYSQLSCHALNEAALDESKGIRCTAPLSATTTWKILLRHSEDWFPLNTAIDFNEDNLVEQSVTLDLNDDNVLAMLKATPNEYSILRFDGLTRTHALPTTTAGQGQEQEELSYDMFLEMKQQQDQLNEKQVQFELLTPPAFLLLPLHEAILRVPHFSPRCVRTGHPLISVSHHLLINSPPNINAI